MKRRLSAMAVLASLALGLGFGGPASATGAAGAPRTVVNAELVPASPLVEQIRNHRRYDRRQWRGGRDWRDRRELRRYHRPPPRSGFSFHFHVPPPRYAPPRYIQPRYARPRYVQPRSVPGFTRAHYRWCQARYRSYRAYDNTFQPYHGPRRQCISPYA